jgi:hypothetical protein
VRLGSKGQEASTGIVTVPGPTRVLAVTIKPDTSDYVIAVGFGVRHEAKPQEWVGSIEPVVGRLIFGLVQGSVSSIGQVRYFPGARPGGRFYEADLGPGAGHADLHL